MHLLNQMVQYPHARCDATFAALSDATRRGVVEALMRQDASISDLAQRFDMTLTGMKKHVGVLEQAGLVRTVKQGRVRTCTLGPSRLEDEMAWMDAYLRMWVARFAALDAVIADLKRMENGDGKRRDEI